MKPGFALDLDHDRIALLQRRAEGWLLVGDVGLDDPALDAKLGDLRRKAGILAPDGFTTKLILPPSQILYTEVDAPGPDRASRRAQITKALDGLTPYPLADLVYDWSRAGGGKVRVAAVARVTLEEAERFAEEYGFCPVAFVACPERGSYAGEPYFGATTVSAQHLPAGEKLERDQDPVRVIDALPPDAFEIEYPAQPHTAEPETGPGDEDQAPDRAEQETDAQAAATDAAETASPAAAETGRQDDLETEAETDEPAMPDAESVNADARTDDEPPLEAAALASDSALLGAASDGLPVPEDDAPEPEASTADMAQIEPEAPVAPTVGELLTPDADSVDSEARTGDEPPLEAEAMVGDAATLGAASDGLAVPEDDALEPEVSAANTADAEPETPATLPEGEPTDSDVEAAETSAFASRRSGAETGADIIAVASRLSFADTETPTAPRIGPATGRLGITDPTLAVPDAELEAEDTSTGPRRPRNRLGRALIDSLPEAKHGTLAQQKQRWTTEAGSTGSAELTSFGTRRQPVAPRGRPRLVRALIALLILAILAIVGWSVLSSSDPDKPPATTSESAAPGETEMQADGSGVSTPSPTEQADAAPELASPETAPAVAQQPDLATASPEPEAMPTLTGPPPEADQEAPAPPPAAESQPSDDSGAALVTRETPAAPASQPSSGLPALNAATADTQLTPQPLPPPAGTVYDFGPDGQIKPTKDGVITPDGFTLIAGKPPVAPPPRPGSATDAAPAQDPAATEPAPDEQGAIDAAAPDTALAGSKPRPRPERIVALAKAAKAQKEAIDAAAAAAAAAEENAPPASALAVASSRRPSQRPSGFSKSVEAAIAAAVAEPQPAPTAAPAELQPQTQTAAAPAEVEIDEPEPMAAVPNMPTSRTVSNQATIKNAINLREINLIGIYGSSSSRRALVRMPNGRYVKLKVGDKLDGGKVAAIGDSELSYVKKGRTIILKITKRG